MYELRPTTRFRHDIRRISKRGFDLELLYTALDILSETSILPQSYKPHPLQGDYLKCVDAHILADWVLIYEILNDTIIVLRRTGTHQDLFKNYR